MLFQVTEIEFDFDDEEDVSFATHQLNLIKQQEIIDETIGQIWEAEDEDDLVEEITSATGWCVCSLDFVHVLR
jgi:hypothetical protein